jgi:hypothetical protein
MVNKLQKLAGIKSKPTAMPAVSAEEMKYKARDALHTITRAEEHKRDRELMKHVKHLAKTQVKAVCK